MIDIHSHLLPGVDDGPKDWKSAVDLCRAMSDIGIRTAVATPHLIDGVYNNVRSKVEPLTRELNDRVASAGIALTILAGAEVDLSSRLVSPRSPDLPCLALNNAVLLEMPMAVLPHAMAGILFSVRSQSLIPVLAHPERNELLQDDLDLAHSWLQTGALLQIDGDSLLGVWGQRAQRCAEELLEHGMVHAMASDAHSCDRRPPRLGEALEAAVRLVGPGATALVTTGPDAILRGLPLPAPLYAIDGARATRKSAGSRGKVREGWVARLFGRRAE